MTSTPVQTVNVPTPPAQPDEPDTETIPDAIEEPTDRAEVTLTTAPAHPLGSDEFGKELDADPDTSMVPSIYLHLLSEHPGEGYGALRLDDDSAVSLHARLHAADIIAGELDHAVEDWRFRPGRALEAAMQSAEAPATTP